MPITNSTPPLPFTKKELNTLRIVLQRLYSEAQTLCPKDVVSLRYEGVSLDVYAGDDRVITILISDVNLFVERNRSNQYSLHRSFNMSSL